MNPLNITLIVLCAVTAFFAWMPEKAVVSSGLDRVGTVIGRVAQPDEVSEVTVTSWDETAKMAKIFQVRRKGQGWTIPSRFDYPADGGSRIGKTAGVMGITRGRYVGEDPKTFAELGVIDPQSEEAKSAKEPKERGKRVQIKDASGGTIVDLIVGNSAGDGSYYVREFGSNEVFTAKVNADISTRFADWVEPNLLKIDAGDVRSVVVRDYSIDEQRGSIDMRSEVDFRRTQAGGDWSTQAAPAGKRPKKSEVDALPVALTALRLTGIRPFDPQWLQKRGFFLSEAPALLERKDLLSVPVGNGRTMVLLGNEGETAVTVAGGLTYHLFFGEIALGEDEDQSADAAAEGEPAAEGEDPAEAKTGHDRYLAVWVSYTRPEDVPADSEADKANRERVAQANQRFMKFFYVISNTDFEKLRPKIDALFEDQPEEAKARGTDLAISAWMKANGERPGVTTTASGLQYEVVDKGREDGKQPTEANRVKVRYVGTRIDGEQFDAGTTEFPVTGVIAGWTEALKLMREGAIWRLTIAPDLAYGDQAQGDKIGANEILQFEVELLEVLE